MRNGLQIYVSSDGFLFQLRHIYQNSASSTWALPTDVTIAGFCKMWGKDNMIFILNKGSKLIRLFYA